MLTLPMRAATPARPRVRARPVPQSTKMKNTNTNTTNHRTHLRCVNWSRSVLSISLPPSRPKAEDSSPRPRREQVAHRSLVALGPSGMLRFAGPDNAFSVIESLRAPLRGRLGHRVGGRDQALGPARLRAPARRQRGRGRLLLHARAAGGEGAAPAAARHRGAGAGAAGGVLRQPRGRVRPGLAAARGGPLP